MIVRLDDRLWFPDPRFGEDDGCIAIGGDLSVDRLILAYSYGIFPWYAFKHQDILWFCPMQRFVIFPNEIHISHSMQQLIRKRQYEVTINRDFDGVIHGCAEAQNRNQEDGAWLGPDIIKAYTELHRQGFAASVEVWDEDQQLVGGLYGVNIGAAFFGESMFSLVPSASKFALIFLARLMDTYGGKLIDCQFETPHLRSMGGRYISYEEYMNLLRAAD